LAAEKFPTVCSGFIKKVMNSTVGNPQLRVTKGTKAETTHDDLRTQHFILKAVDITESLQAGPNIVAHTQEAEAGGS
jgi:hypothetical protein